MRCHSYGACLFGFAHLLQRYRSMELFGEFFFAPSGQNLCSLRIENMKQAPGVKFYTRRTGFDLICRFSVPLFFLI